MKILLIIALTLIGTLISAQENISMSYDQMLLISKEGKSTLTYRKSFILFELDKSLIKMYSESDDDVGSNIDLYEVESTLEGRFHEANEYVDYIFEGFRSVNGVVVCRAQIRVYGDWDGNMNIIITEADMEGGILGSVHLKGGQ